MNDHDRLKAYTQTGDEAAFQALAETYAGLVFGCALRRTGNRQLAEEITQNVFASLAKKAKALLKGKRSLGPWLHRATVLESSHQLRTEYRHRRRVEALADKTSEFRMNPDHSSSIEKAELSAVLDEALNDLKPSEREAVFMKFFENRTYGEIGRAVGSSEEACRKRVTRSLDKLAGILNRQGVQVTSVALAGYLTTELAQAAPAGLALSSATAATGAVKSLSTSSQTLILIQTMISSKTGGFVLGGLAFCLLCGTGGYVAGKSSAEQRYRDLVLLSPRSPSSPDRTMAGNPSMGAVEALPESIDVRALLAQAGQHFLNGAEDAATYRKGSALLAQLKPEHLPEAIAYLNGLPDRDRVWAGLHFGIVSLWSKTEPAAALTYANEQANEQKESLRVFGEIARSWASREPDAAFDWFREHAIPANVSHDEIRRCLYEGWAGTDAPAAVASIEQLSKDEARESLRAVAGLVARDVNREAVMTAIDSIEDRSLRGAGLAAAAGEWARWEPARAAAWSDELTFESQGIETRVTAAVAENWMDENLEQALDWFWPRLGEGNPFRKEVIELVEGMWIREDPEAARAWAAKHQISLK